MNCPIEGIKFPNQVPILPRIKVRTISKDQPKFPKIVAAFHDDHGSLIVGRTDSLERAENSYSPSSRGVPLFLSGTSCGCHAKLSFSGHTYRHSHPYKKDMTESAVVQS
jgi:hypothetical protein